MKRSGWVWACLGLLLLSRLPAIGCPFQLNVDEGQMVAQAMRYFHHPTPWASVDGETGGPVLSWFLALAHCATLPFSFRTAHLLAAGCLVAVLCASFGAARRLLGETPAAAALAAGAWWLALSPDEDFIHYSSELVPDVLIACALLLWVSLRGRERGGDLRRLLFALALGLVPWAKLQAAPIALVLGLWACGETLFSAGAGAILRLRRLAILVGAALLPSALILCWVREAGAWDQFWHSYILANAARAGGKSWPGHLSDLANLTLHREGSAWFLGAAVLLIGALWRGGNTAMRGTPGKVLGLALLWLLAAILAVLAPTTQYSHYQQLCLVPLVLLVAACAALLVGDGVNADRRGWTFLILGIVPLPVISFIQHGGVAMVKQTLRYDHGPAFQSQSFVVGAVQQFAPGATSLAVWGWAPYLYVDLQIPPGTRDAGYASLTDGNPSQEFMRTSFIRDLAASQPQVIVDTEDDIVSGRRRTAPASFPALAALLRRDYRLVGRGTAMHGPGRSLLVDIYLRRPGSAPASLP
ncbi:MAG TPA: hypothetical protein VHV47_10950 [Opitutaceae bacterium]|nr:hypothetical protein [Opitutaceae bacterium]